MEERNAINWFEIPVTYFERSKTFYETILNINMTENEMQGYQMGFFPTFMGKVSGAIVKGEGYEPCTKGSQVYLNCNPDLSEVISKVEAAGGQILVPKTQITPEIGYFAFILDTEGNKIALHSQD